jgi:hypothetical protein
MDKLERLVYAPIHGKNRTAFFHHNTRLGIMEQPDINHVLKVYLGADANGGYQPIGCDKRLRAAFPRDQTQMMQLMSRYLDEDHPMQEWTERTLAQETSRFVEILNRKFPELDAITIRALANRWSFGNR